MTMTRHAHAPRPLRRFLSLRLWVLTASVLPLGTGAELVGQESPAIRQDGNPFTGVDRFLGEFANDRVRMRIEAAANGYRGMITLNGNPMPFTAAGSDAKLTGTFDFNGASYSFTAAFEGDVLRFSSGGTSQDLKREGSGAGDSAGSAAGANDPGTVEHQSTNVAPGKSDLSALADFGPVRADSSRAWTILVYMVGDNDLETFALRDLNELETGLPPGGVEVIVLVDRAEGYESAEGDWTDARVYRIVPDGNQDRLASELIAQPGELNLGDPRTLATFISSGIKTFPAPNTMLIMWDHGGGWAMMANDLDAPGAPTGSDYLTVQEAAAGIREGLTDADAAKLDIIGFDMCLMSQLETAVEFQDLADVLVASQAIEPGDGWPFNEILPVIARGTLGSRRIAQEIVRAYSRFYDDRNERIATLSAMDLARTGEVLAALEALIESLSPHIDEHWQDFSRSVFYAESYTDRTEIRKGPQAVASVDLLDVCKRLANVVGSIHESSEYKALVSAMDQFVLASHNSRLRRLSNGVAIYAPVHGKMMDVDHQTTRFGTLGWWGDFLDGVHSEQQHRTSQPSFSNMRLTDPAGNAVQQVEPLSFGHRISFTVTGDNLIWTAVWFGENDPDTGETTILGKSFVYDPYYFTRRADAVADVIDLVMPEYVDGANELYQEENGMVLRVTDGDNVYPATIDMSALNDPDSIRVPALYSHPSVGTHEAVILFDSALWYAESLFLLTEAPGGRILPHRIKAEPDAEVTLLLETVTAAGESSLRRGATFRWGEGPELLLDMLQPGSYKAIFFAETITGESAVDACDYNVGRNDFMEERLRSGQYISTPELLEGTWDLKTLAVENEKMVQQPTGFVYEMSPHRSIDGVMVCKVTKEDEPSFERQKLLITDTRHIPCYKIVEYGEGSEELIDYNLMTGFYGVDTATNTAMLSLIRLDNSTPFVFVKRGAPNQYSGPAGPGGGAGGGQSTGVVQQQLTLVGWWQDLSDGSLFVLDQRNWQMYANGTMVDAGDYLVEADIITLRSGVSGAVVQFRFAFRDANVIDVVDAYGEASILQRVQPPSP